MLDLLAVGDVLLDVLASPEAGGGRHGRVTVRAGGSAVNAARTATALGASAGVVGAVGDDAAGRAIAGELARLGIEARLTVDRARASGTAVYRGGEIELADRGANAGFRAPALPEARATLVSGYLPQDAVRATLAGAHGIRALDLQGLLEDGYDADVVLGPNLDLARHGPLHRVACATRGAAGAEAVSGDERAHAVPPQLRESSPVGAGDAFAAAFLLALADGLALAECVARGCAAGAAA